MWKDLLKVNKPIILKAPAKKAKKGQFDERMGKDIATVISDPDLEQVKKQFDDWITTCGNMRGQDIGITGAKTDSLLDHVVAHVEPAVQREGQGPRDGAKDVVKRITAIMKEDHLYTIGELRAIDDLIEVLEDVESDPDTNPRNIPFTTPISVSKDETVFPDEPNTFGHYRTPNYSKHQKKVGGANDFKITNDKWYSDEIDTATPPFWQALFSNGEGDVVKQGLLPILKEIKEVMEGQEIEIYKIDSLGIENRKSLEKMPSFMKTLEDLLKMPQIYHAYNKPNPKEIPYKRVLLNIGALQREVSKAAFDVQGARESGFIKDIADSAEMEETIAEISTFKIRRISAGVLRTIIKNNIDIKNFKGPFGTGILTSKVRAYIDNPEVSRREKALEREKETVKKSWSYALWG